MARGRSQRANTSAGVAGKSGCLSASVRIVEKFGVTTTEGDEEVEVKLDRSIRGLPLNKEWRMSCLQNNPSQGATAC